MLSKVFLPLYLLDTSGFLHAIDILRLNSFFWFFSKYIACHLFVSFIIPMIWMFCIILKKQHKKNRNVIFFCVLMDWWFKETKRKEKNKTRWNETRKGWMTWKMISVLVCLALNGLCVCEWWFSDSDLKCGWNDAIFEIKNLKHFYSQSLRRSLSFV